VEQPHRGVCGHHDDVLNRPTGIIDVQGSTLRFTGFPDVRSVGSNVWSKVPMHQAMHAMRRGEASVDVLRRQCRDEQKAGRCDQRSYAMDAYGH
jgi:hypothetical protein